MLAVLCVAVASSCRPHDPPLRVGVPAWAPAGLAVVARDLGYFDDGDIELVEYRSPIELARHLREGHLDAAALTLDFVPYLAASFATLDVVFVAGVSQGADALVAGAGIGDLSALGGKRIAVEASPLGAHMLLRALKAGSLALRNVEPVLIDSQDQAAAFFENRVDALVTREADRTRLLAGKATSLFDSSRTPGAIVDVLVVPHEIAGARGAALRELVDAWLAAIARLQDDHAATVGKLAAVLALDARSAEAALSGWRLGDLALNREMLGGASPRLAAALAEIESLASASGLLHGGRRGGVRFDAAYLPAIASGGGVR